ncbi:MAG: DUF2391 family protein, partial [Cyanobacteria bacterium J06659_2]
MENNSRTFSRVETPEAAIALVLLRRITLETPLPESLGKLVFEGVPFSLGVTLARSTLSR